MTDEMNVFRKEIKYKLNYLEYSSLLYLLGNCLKEDEHGLRQDGYMVRSLYFDSLDDTDFFDKEDGYEERKKLRLRVYQPEDVHAKLEIKSKYGDNQRKESLVITRAEAREMILGNYEFLSSYDSQIARTVILLLKKQVYRPKTMIEYRRKAFVIPGNDTRITFDREIHASESDFDLFNSRPLYYLIQNRNEVVMEVKYCNFLFGYLRELLSEADREQITYSKYYMARSISKNIRMNV